MIWAIRKASCGPRIETRATSFCSATKSLSSGGADAAHRLRQDHVAHRLRLGQPDRERRVALAAVDRADPGAVDLGDVGAVGERQRDAAEDDRVGRQPGQLRAPGSRSRPGRRAGSSGCRGRRRRRPSPAAAAGTAPAPRLVRTRAIDQAEDQHRDLDDHEELDVEPEALEDVREGVLEDAPGEEGLADRRPAGAGQDPAPRGRR